MRILYCLSIFLLCPFFLVAQKTIQPDLILFNGKIWTGNESPAFVEAIAISGNKITRIGGTADIKKLANPATKLIDLEGKLATAGINDAHIHFLDGSLGLAGVDLYRSQNFQEALNAIENYVKKYPEKKWITGMGWQYNLFEGGMPTTEALKELDRITKDRPVVLDAYDGHSIWVNSKAMELGGISKETQFEGFGAIIKDANGNPTGAFTEAAGSLISKIVPPPTTEEKLQALRMGMKFAASLGITSIQNASGSVEEFSLYETLLKKGELTLRSSTAFSAGKKTTEADIQEFIKVKNRTRNHPILKAASIKFMLDGVIESHTSPMLEPYSDAGRDGTNANSDFALPLDVYQRLLNRFDKEGFQIYTHAIGDRTVREALNAYEKAMVINGTKGRRHRIEHIEQSSPEDIPRFNKLGVMASMEPIHANPGNIVVWAKAVGEKRLPNSFVWQSMLKNKAHLVFSSDWPACTNPDPILGLHIAVNRQTPEGEPEGGWIPDQRISIKDALKSYTQEGAYVSFEENVKGKIQPGYLADIIVFSQDLFTIPSMDIAKTKVALTLFDGKIVYNEAEKIKIISMKTEKAILAGGCFWGVEELIRHLPGVKTTVVGYTGGDVPNATYRNHGTHAEGISVTFDPEILSYRKLLEYFFQIHNPTTKNRQGNDIGLSYRSAIFYLDEAQKETSIQLIKEMEASGKWPGKIVTEIEPAGDFWDAEKEHQDYLQKNPGGYTCHFERPDWKL